MKMETHMHNYNQTLLPNKMTLVTIKKPGQLFSLNLGIKVGSLNESLEEKGISHFIEHMLFKGTIHEDNEELNRSIEMLGGDFNAFTDYISTVFTVSALREELDSSLRILQDMLLYPAFNPEEMEKERGVILSELRSSLDDPEEISHRSLFFKAYEKSPLKYDVIGLHKTISRFTPGDLQAFHHKHYIPNNAVLVLISELSDEEALKLVTGYFGQWEEGRVEKKAYTFEKNKPGFHTTTKDIEQSTLSLLYSFKVSEKEKLPLRVLNFKLGQSGNSILFRELREKRGLVYDVYSDLDLTENIHNLIIYTQVADESLDMAMEVIVDILEDIKRKAYFHPVDLEVMKKVMKTSIYGTLENIHDLSSFILEEILNNEDPMDFQKDLLRLEEVTLDDIVEVAKKIFNGPTVFKLRSDSHADHHTNQ